MFQFIRNNSFEQNVIYMTCA